MSKADISPAPPAENRKERIILLVEDNDCDVGLARLAVACNRNLVSQERADVAADYDAGTYRYNRKPMNVPVCLDAVRESCLAGSRSMNRRRPEPPAHHHG